NTELLRIFREQRSAEEPKLTIEESTSPQPTPSALTDALNVMCHLYNGFDNRLVSLKTWGDMNREPTAKFVGQNSGGWKTPEMEEFVRNDL
ncbi:hypothetical protein OFM95_29000, partial [Escherichia coli]|nr:hypothetical protein [Escherichia coli]